jgi:hypothetical protein
MNPYEELANAIVLQAIKDYRRLWHWKKDDHVKHELIHFFYSEWFAILTKLGPTYLIEKLEEESNAKRRLYHRL